MRTSRRRGAAIGRWRRNSRAAPAPSRGAHRVHKASISGFPKNPDSPRCRNEFLRLLKWSRMFFNRFHFFLHIFLPFSRCAKAIPTYFKMFRIGFWSFQNVLKGFAITSHRISGDSTPSKSVKYRFLMRFQSFKNRFKNIVIYTMQGASRIAPSEN